MTTTLEEEPVILDKKPVTIPRCFKGKVLTHPKESLAGIATGKDALMLLQATHQDFNRAVREVIIAIEGGLKSNNPALVPLLNWMLAQNANSAHNVLEPLTIAGLKTDRKSYPPEQIENLCCLTEENFLLLDVNAKFPWLKTALRRKIFQKAVEKIKAYANLKKLWREGDNADDINQADFEKDIETTYKRLKKIITAYALDLQERREEDPWLDALLEGYVLHKGSKGPVWLRHFLAEKLENIVHLGQLFDDYGSGVLGKENWLKRKAQWESQCGKGVTVRPNYERGHQLFMALRACGDTLIKWRDQHAVYQDVTLEEAADLDEIPARKKRWALLKERNPELKKLLDLQQEYWKHYREFKRPPGKRLPDPAHHPEWIDFQKDSGYKHLDFINRTVQLMVASNPNEEGENRYTWQTFHFGIDQRFQALTPVRVTKIGTKVDLETGEVKKKDITYYRWHDPKTGEAANIDVKGIKLIVRNHRAELVFRYEYEKDLFKSIKQDGRTKIGTRTLAFDLGQKYLAAITGYEQTIEGAQQKKRGCSLFNANAFPPPPCQWIFHAQPSTPLPIAPAAHRR